MKNGVSTEHVRGRWLRFNICCDIFIFVATFFCYIFLLLLHFYIFCYIFFVLLDFYIFFLYVFVVATFDCLFVYVMDLQHCSDCVGVTLADEDANSMLTTDEAKRD